MLIGANVKLIVVQFCLKTSLDCWELGNCGGSRVLGSLRSFQAVIVKGQGLEIEGAIPEPLKNPK
jgi:hypothetical protein